MGALYFQVNGAVNTRVTLQEDGNIIQENF